MPKDQRDRSNAEFERLPSELQASGELLGGEALGDPTTARLYRGDRSGETVELRPVMRQGADDQ